MSPNHKRYGRYSKKLSNVSFSEFAKTENRYSLFLGFNQIREKKGAHETELLKTMYQKETYNINEVSVRVDFDSSDSSSEDHYFDGQVSKDQFFSRFKSKS